MNHDIGPAIGLMLFGMIILILLTNFIGSGSIYRKSVDVINSSFSGSSSTAQNQKKEPSENDFIPVITRKDGSNAVSGYSCVSKKNPEYAELIRVIDGDTITVRMSNGDVQKVRYIGVNTAEEGDTMYQTGTDTNADLLSNGHGRVTLYKDISETDKYGRLLRYVFAGDTFVNYELVNKGVARALTIAPDTSCSMLFETADRFMK
ncbi:MAG: thermonuclease family protein [Anaerolineaceae bacterium]|nr:thermonuclease family protein [Anaerolineaceae bacterium]